MAGLNIKAMRKNYQENQRGGDIWKPPVGLTKVYIHPPCRGEDDVHEPTTGTNLIAVGVHYELDAKHSMSVCLDPERNPILNHPFLKEFLKRKKIKIGADCPVEKAIASGRIDSDEANNSRLNTRYLFGITPIASKAKRVDEDWTKIPPTPSVMLVGSNIYNGIMDEIFENGDITDPNQAIFLIISREGIKKNDTKYTVKADPDTVRKPMSLPPKFRAMIDKALTVGGDCDLFKIVANMTKSHEEVQGLLAGSSVKTGRGMSSDDEEDDDLPDPDDLDLGEDEEEEVPLPTKKAAKKTALVVEEDEEGELVDEDDDEPPPPPKKAAKVAPTLAKKAKPLTEEDDEEELLDEDEEEAPPPKKATKPVVKAKPLTEEDDDEDLDLDELDAEIEAATKASTKKPVKASKLAPVEDDEDELLDEDEEEAPPPPKKGPGRPKKSS